MRRRNAAAAHLHDSPIQALPTPPMRVDHAEAAGGACSEASNSHGTNAGAGADVGAGAGEVRHDAPLPPSASSPEYKSQNTVQ